ncbi:MAG: hypothetical protein U0527_00895 [Candidatus Eisenbacteria bacterium]
MMPRRLLWTWLLLCAALHLNPSPCSAQLCGSWSATLSAANIEPHIPSEAQISASARFWFCGDCGFVGDSLFVGLSYPTAFSSIIATMRVYVPRASQTDSLIAEVPNPKFLGDGNPVFYPPELCTYGSMPFATVVVTTETYPEGEASGVLIADPVYPVEHLTWGKLRARYR